MNDPIPRQWGAAWQRPDWKQGAPIVLFLAIVILYKVFLNQRLPLHFDEAYYWMMSQHLAAGYFDIPPVLPMMMRFATSLLGESVWAIRMVGIGCFVGTLFFCHRLSEALYGARVARWTVISLTVLPLSQVGMTITTTDAPLALFFSASVYFAYRSLLRDRWRDWILLGVAVGCAFASKYTAVLIPLALGIFCLCHDRSKFLRPQVWLAASIALMVFSPVLWWAGQEAWEPFLFRYRLASGNSQHIEFKYLGEYLAGALLIFTPVWGLMFVGILPRRWRLLSKFEILLLSFSLIFLAFFAYKGLFSGMAPNWYFPAVLTAMPFIIHQMVDRKILFRIGMALSLLLSLGVNEPHLLGLTGKTNVHSRLFGYEQGIRALAEQVPKDAQMCSNYYSSASLMNFYFPERRNNIRVLSKRRSDFNYWPLREKQPSCFAIVQQGSHFEGSYFCESLNKIDSYIFKQVPYSEVVHELYFCENVKNMESIEFEVIR